MERLTIKSEIVSGHYNLKCMCTVCTNGIVDSEDGCVEYCELHDDCNDCQIQEAFDRLAAYEDTGLTPEEVETLKAFKAYFDDMYGKGLEVANWHMNGNLEPFDNFYEKASNAAKIRCKDCDYLNMDDGKPYCCHARMSTNGLDDWCYYGVKRKENNNA